MTTTTTSRELDRPLQAPLLRAVRLALMELNISCMEIEASALISREGSVIAAERCTRVDKGSFAALSAPLLALAERANKEFAHGDMQMVLFEGEQGLMLLLQVGPEAMLTLAARPSANAGMLLHAARRSVARLELLLLGGS